MFLKKEDLGKVIYGYKVDQLTDSNDFLIMNAIEAAENEIFRLLKSSKNRKWLDGRLVCDANELLSQKGKNRHPILVKHAKAIAKWWLVELCNLEETYDKARRSYNASIDWLKRLASGEVVLEHK